MHWDVLHSLISCFLGFFWQMRSCCCSMILLVQWYGLAPHCSLGGCVCCWPTLTDYYSAGRKRRRPHLQKLCQRTTAAGTNLCYGD
jgi:hypothetical protein